MSNYIDSNIIAREKIYDEICNLLTDYEGNGSGIPAEIDNFYNILVEIQNNWEGIITAQDE